jgi:hypothetical protein
VQISSRDVELLLPSSAALYDGKICKTITVFPGTFRTSSNRVNYSEDIFFMVHREKSEHIFAKQKAKHDFSATKISH